MDRRFLLPFALGLAGCTPGLDHRAVMDRIEQAVRLPAGALPLGRYARAYAKVDGRQVVAVYFVPTAGTAMAAGERRWFDDARRLPRPVGAGCLRVDVRYALDTHRIIRIACPDPA